MTSFLVDSYLGDISLKSLDPVFVQANLQMQIFIFMTVLENASYIITEQLLVGSWTCSPICWRCQEVLWGHHDFSSRHFPGTSGNNKPTILAFCGLWDTLAQKFVFSALEIKIRIICELFSECWNMILELPKSNYNLRDSAVQALQ